MSAPQESGNGLLTRLMASPRLAAVVLLAIALVAVWQSGRLARWGLDGPGPGLFPTIVTGVFAFLALVVLLLPRAAAAGADADPGTGVGANADSPAVSGDRPHRRFAIYSIALGLLAVGAFYAGFTVTTVVLAVLVIRFAEARPWTAAITYGVLAAGIGLVGFGWLLRVDLPVGAIDSAILSLLR